MKTRVLKIEANAVRPGTVREIVRLLAGGAVIVYPTDTFYGLGANSLSREPLGRILEIKRRSAARGLPVLVSDLEMARSMAAAIPPVFYGLAFRYWPGPLTLVLRAASHLPQELVGRGRTIGVRLPAVGWLQTLIKETEVPLVATSANISGEAEIASAGEAKTAFMGKVDLILDGGRTPGG